MGRYFITGRQGSGKTSVIRELQRRGCTAYNTDELPDTTRLQHRRSGKFIDWPETGEVDWDNYAWNWQETELRHLLESDDPVFIGAVVSNQDQFLHLFDKVFALIISSTEQRRRLGMHEHGYSPTAIERHNRDHDEKQLKWHREGIILLEGEQPTAAIVDSILDHTNS